MHAARVTELAALSGRTVADVLEYWTERAAIFEYGGGFSRGEAEQLAMESTERWAQGSTKAGGEP